MRAGADVPADTELPSPDEGSSTTMTGLDGPAGARRLATIAVLVVVLLAAVGAGALLTPFGPGRSPGRFDERLASLHDAGVTGENVTVGVVDVTGFDTDHAALDGRVRAARAFGGASVGGGGDAHGTAAAAVVARTAPDAGLYLASFEGTDGFRAAVVWLVEAGVDVVVAPVSFYGTPGDGSAGVARMADYAVRRGVVFVAAAGNLGRGHWAGEFDPVGPGVHRFGNGTRNYLRPLTGRRLELWLSWEDPSRNFTVEVYAETDDGPRLVARSRPYAADEYPNERVVARLRDDRRHFFVVRGPVSAGGTRIEVSAPTHAFETRRRAGSVVAPATAASALAVGAYGSAEGGVEPFSSVGPVESRPGIDLVAPHRVATAPSDRFVGSSASASYVAGVAALVLGVAPALSPRGVAAVLEATARDVASEGVDPRAGSGLVRPRRAVERARDVARRRSNRDLSQEQRLVAAPPTT